MDCLDGKNTKTTTTKANPSAIGVLNRNANIDFMNEPIFGNSGLGIQRFDKMKYPQLFAFYHQQKNAFWDVNEIDITKDKMDYLKLRDDEKFIFTSNLKYQILLDSVQLRGIDLLQSKLQNTQVEAFCSIWKFFEQIHSISYSHIIQNVYTQPSEIFDNITNDKDIMERGFSVVERYNKLIENTNDFETIYLTLISIYLLEGVRFYISFACSYSFAEKGMMEGNSKIIQLINKDEIIHFKFTQTLINILRNEKSEGFQEIINTPKMIYKVQQLFDETVEDECRFIKHLFGNCACGRSCANGICVETLNGGNRRLDNLNVSQLKGYVKYLANIRGNEIGYTQLYPFYTHNPIPWISKYTTSGLVQTPPQESEIIEYNIKNTINDLASTTFDFYF